MTIRFVRSAARCLVLPLLLVLGTTAALAQSRGLLAGTVVDQTSGETLIGVNVLIEGTMTGAATDLDGHYRITGLEPGTYTVVFSYVSYVTQRVTGVEIRPGQTTTLDLALAEEAFQLEGEVIVEARRVLNNEASLLSVRQRAMAVSDAISSEAISRAGASSAADAMQKVTGTSVVGGRYVYVRGLGDRYMNTQLNGATLPSADPDRNAVAFDLFPSDLLENIVTTKTFTPDQPGSFTGGNVNINTQTFPEDFTFNFSTSVGYNADVNLRDDFQTYRTGGRDWLGYDDGTRDIPALWQDPAAQAPRLTSSGTTDSTLARQYDTYARSFTPGGFTTQQTTTPLNQGFSTSLGNQFSLFGRPLGYLGSFSYSRDYSNYTGGVDAKYEQGGSSLDRRLADSRSTEDVLWGGLGTFSYRLAPTQTLGASLLYTRSASNETRFQEGINQELSSADIEQRRLLAYTERTVQTLQVRGDHAFPALRNLRVDWSAARARSTQNEPDRRVFNNLALFVRDANDAVVDTTYSYNNSVNEDITRFFRDLEEDGWDLGLNVAQPFGNRAFGGTLKVGGAYNNRARAFRERTFRYESTTWNYAAFNASGRVEDLIDANLGIIDTTGTTTLRYRPGVSVGGFTSPTNSYDYTQDVYAGFAMVEMRPVARLRTILGARFESSTLDMRNYCYDQGRQFSFLGTVYDCGASGAQYTLFGRDSTFSLVESRQTYNDVLPALNVVYEVTPTMNLRVAYGRTLARPTARELAPFESFDLAGGDRLTGNPFLERTLVDNVDLRWEWFTRPGEILAVSGFAKLMQNPIEKSVDLSSEALSTQVYSFQNLDNAQIFGLEFEARRRFEALPLVPGGVEIGTNLSLTFAEITIPDALVEARRAYEADPATVRPLQGQSPAVFNLDVTYALPTGTTVGFYYNTFGRRLSAVGGASIPDEFEFATHNLDFTLRQPLFRGVGLKLSVKNLLDEDAEFGIRYNDQDLVTRRYSRGRSYSVGVSYRID